MDRIKPFPLWLGHAGDCQDIARLSDLGIEAVVQLAVEEPQAPLPRDILLVRVPLLDGTGNRAALLRLAVQSVAGLLKDRIPTLVCCSAGASRSPAIAACALAIIQKKSPAECLELVYDFRKTDVSPGLWQDLLDLHQ